MNTLVFPHQVLKHTTLSDLSLAKANLIILKIKALSIELFAIVRAYKSFILLCLFFSFYFMSFSHFYSCCLVSNCFLDVSFSQHAETYQKTTSYFNGQRRSNNKLFVLHILLYKLNILSIYNFLKLANMLSNISLMRRYITASFIFSQFLQTCIDCFQYHSRSNVYHFL